MAFSRRTALLLGAPALLAGDTCISTAAAATTSGVGFVDAASLGITPSNSAKSNRRNLIARLSSTARCILFRPGDYQIDNSGDHIVITNFSGQLVMQPGARFVFTDKARRGIEFSGGTGARLYGLSTVFATAPTRRVGAEECVLFENTTDTYVENVRINGSAAAGMLFLRCTRPTVIDAVIKNTMADGLHFANCQDGCADRITTSDTGDDGVAFVNYADGPANTGGLATNVRVTRSKTRGITAMGQSGVTIRNFSVKATSNDGLLCGGDPAGNIRVPTDVHFENGRITGAGTHGGSGNRSGIEWNNVGTLYLSNITIDSAARYGVGGVRGTVTILDVTVTKSAASGFNLQSGTYIMDRISATNTGGAGLFANDCSRVEYGTITLRNTSQKSSLYRALDVENNAFVLSGRVWVYDNQATATGYIIGACGSQKGNLGTVVATIGSRSLVIDNPSGLSYAAL